MSALVYALAAAALALSLAVAFAYWMLRHPSPHPHPHPVRVERGHRDEREREVLSRLEMVLAHTAERQEAISAQHRSIMEEFESVRTGKRGHDGP